MTFSVYVLVAIQSTVLFAGDDPQQPSREQLHARARVMLQLWQMEKLSRQTWEQKRAVIEVLFSTPVPLESLKQVGGNTQEFWRALFGLDPDFARRNEYLQIAAEARPPIDSVEFAFQYSWLMSWSRPLIDEGATPPAGLANHFAVHLLRQPPISGQADAGTLMKTFRDKEQFRPTEDQEIKELIKSTLNDFVESQVKGERLFLPYKVDAAVALIPTDIAGEVIDHALTGVEQIETSDASPNDYKTRVHSLLGLAASVAGAVDRDKADTLIERVQQLQARTRVKDYVLPFDEIIRKLNSTEFDQKKLDLVYAYIDSIGEADNQREFEFGDVMRQLNEEQVNAVVEKTLKRLKAIAGNEINSRTLMQFLGSLPSQEAKRRIIDGWLEICKSIPDGEVRADWLATIAGFYTIASPPQQQAMRDRFIENIRQAQGVNRFKMAMLQRAVADSVSREQILQVIQILSETPPAEQFPQGKMFLIRDYSAIADRMAGNARPGERRAGINPLELVEFDPQSKREDLPKPEDQLDERYLRIAAAIDLGDPDKLPNLFQNPEIADQTRIPPIFQFVFAKMSEEQKTKTVDRLLQLAKQERELPAVRPEAIVLPQFDLRLPLQPIRPLIYASQYLNDADRRRTIEFYLRHRHDIHEYEWFETAFADAVAWSDKESCVAYWKLLGENQTARTSEHDILKLSILAARLHRDAILVCAQAADETLSARGFYLVQRAMLERVKRASAEEQSVIYAQLSKGAQTGLVKVLTETLSTNLRIIKEADAVIDEFRQLLAKLQKSPSIELWEQFQKFPLEDALHSRFKNADRVETVRELLNVPAQSRDQWNLVLSRVAMLSKNFAASTPDDLLAEVLDRYSVFDKLAWRATERFPDRFPGVAGAGSGKNWLRVMSPAAASRLMPFVLSRMENETVVDSWQDFSYAMALAPACSEAGRDQFQRVLVSNLREYLGVAPMQVVEYLVNHKVPLEADSGTLQKIVDALKSPNSVKEAEEKLLLLLKQVTGQEFANRDAAVQWIQMKFPDVDLVSNP